MMFPEAELLGVDIVMPDLTFLKENQSRSARLILTHGHEDHIGAVPYFLAEIDVPVYGTAFTLALVERRLEEYDLEKDRACITRQADADHRGRAFQDRVHPRHPLDRQRGGAGHHHAARGHHPHRRFQSRPHSHRQRAVRPAHAGRLRQARRAAAAVAIRPMPTGPATPKASAPSGPRMEEIFNRADRRVVVSCFSSSIHRIQLILDLAQEYGRRSPSSAGAWLSVTEIAHDLGLLDIPDGILLRPQDVMSTRPTKVAILISGTQGEPMSALARVAVDNHKHISVEQGDTVVLSSRIIPGNEKAIFRMIDHMARRGADVMYGSMNPPLHVSGHASVEELKLVLNLVRPRYFMPDPRRIPPAVQARPAGRAPAHSPGWKRPSSWKRARCWRSTTTARARPERCTVGRVCIDSGSVDDVVEDLVIRDRRHLSEDGIVLPIIAINRHTGRIESLPEIVSRGFALAEDGSDFMQSARQVVAKTLEARTRRRRPTGA